jgi:hypothetical protein
MKAETINPFLTIAPSLICMNLSFMAAFAAWKYRTLFNIEYPSSAQI